MTILICFLIGGLCYWSMKLLSQRVWPKADPLNHIMFGVCAGVLLAVPVMIGLRYVGVL